MDYRALMRFKSTVTYCNLINWVLHDDVIKWKHFPPVPVNSPHKGQWRGALLFSLICVWINGWVNNREAGDLRRHRGHYDVNVMFTANIYTVTPDDEFMLGYHLFKHGIVACLVQIPPVPVFGQFNGMKHENLVLTNSHDHQGRMQLIFKWWNVKKQSSQK